jgi:hypothetical protein
VGGLGLGSTPRTCELVEEPRLHRIDQLELGEARRAERDKLIEDLVGLHLRDYCQRGVNPCETASARRLARLEKGADMAASWS